MLTDLQRKFYFSGRYKPKSHVEKVGPWPAICEINGWRTNDHDRRYALHESLGLPASLTEWDNRHFNRFLGAAERMWAKHASSSQPSTINHQPRERDRDRENVMHTLKAHCANLGEPYVRKLADDMYGLACWEELATADLVKLRNTLNVRARQRRGKSGTVVRDEVAFVNPGPGGFVLIADTPPTSAPKARAPKQRAVMRETASVLPNHGVSDDNTPF